MELLAVLVVVATLALLAVPGWRAIVATFDGRAARSELAAILGGAEALIEMGTPDPAVTSLASAVGDAGRVPQLTPSNRTTEVSLAVAQSGDAAEWQGYNGLARRTRNGRCALARHRPGSSDRPETWMSSAPEPTGCTGRAALAGPGASTPGPLPVESWIPSPDGLLAQRGDRTIELAWDTVEHAHGYHVYVSGVFSEMVAGPSVVLTGLPLGEEVALQVSAVGLDGRASELSEPVVIDARASGPWDARLAWSYDDNDACWEGASTWSYQVIVSVPKGAGIAGAYRVHLEVAGGEGQSVDGPLLIALTDAHPPDLHGTELVGTDPTNPDDTRLCAAAGNPEPPFVEVWLTLERTGQTQRFGSSGQTRLQADQVEQQDDGSDPAPALPSR